MKRTKLSFKVNSAKPSSPSYYLIGRHKLSQLFSCFQHQNIFSKLINFDSKNTIRSLFIGTLGRKNVVKIKFLILLENVFI